MTVATKSGLSDNTAAVISYFTFVPAFTLLLLPFYKNNGYVRFHAWQSVLLCMAAFVTEILLGIVALLTLFLASGSLIVAARVISLLWLVLWVVCVIQALNGKSFKIPLLGRIAEKLAMK
jgi:uncharacterized membrane protein